MTKAFIKDGRIAEDLPPDVLVKLRAIALHHVRTAVAGEHRPSYCADPATFEPHPWVIEAVVTAIADGFDQAFSQGFIDGLRHVADVADQMANGVEEADDKMALIDDVKAGGVKISEDDEE